MTNQPAEIPIGASKACFQLEAVDDDIVEAEEEFTLVTETNHQNDTVDGSTRVVITDNDCKLGEYHDSYKHHLTLIGKIIILYSQMLTLILLEAEL